MGDPVFANTMQVSSKSMSGKSICQFPDVCWTPPQTPATPTGVPIPYPNTAMASDTTDGSSSVMIGGEMVMLKDRSNFKQSVGDEAGSAPMKGMMTSSNKGTAFFIAWSMDVKVEGENVVRNLDMTTHNHGSKNATGAVPTVHTAMASAGWDPKNCTKEILAEQKACQDFDPYKEGKSVCKAAGMMKGVRSVSEAKHQANYEAIQSAPAHKDAKNDREKALGCLKARRCRTVPYSPKDKKGTKGCCPSQTPDHVLPKASFKNSKGGKLKGWGKYKMSKAPCICAEGPSNHGKGSHPLRHSWHKSMPPEGIEAGDKMPFDDATDHAATGAGKVFKASGCTQSCVKGQLDEQHKDMMSDKEDPAPVKYTPSGTKKSKAELTKSSNIAPGAPD